MFFFRGNFINLAAIGDIIYIKYLLWPKTQLLIISLTIKFLIVKQIAILWFATHGICQSCLFLDFVLAFLLLLMFVLNWIVIMWIVFILVLWAQTSDSHKYSAISWCHVCVSSVYRTPPSPIPSIIKKLEGGVVGMILNCNDVQGVNRKYPWKFKYVILFLAGGCWWHYPHAGSWFV